MKKKFSSHCLQKKSNCWCLAHVEKAAFLIDGAAYFSAVADAIDQAQETIFIAAWDIDSRIFLLRGNGTPMTGQILALSSMPR